ncbi:MAG: phosphate ABC transporter permease PstA [Alphaproteobacteria bacterium]
MREPTDWFADDMQRRINRRYAADARFKWYGIAAIGFAIAILVLLLGSILVRGIPGFMQTQINLEIFLEPSEFTGIEEQTGEDLDRLIAGADYTALYRDALRERFPDVTGRSDIMALSGLISSGGRDVLRGMVRDDPSVVGSTVDVWLPAAGDVHSLITGFISKDSPESERRINDKEISWVERLDEDGDVRTVLSRDFFTKGASREPELAGVWGAVVGSFFTLVVTLLISFPIGVATAVYLEEFAPKNRLSDFIEVNINNLAAVPSIVYGLLGLAVFLNVFHLPRSAPLVGGMTLALMTLPTIIIASRAALKAVPPSIRDAATGLGASRVQVTFHHVLPLAMPGVLTGTIIGMAQALGETAPLLMIGMVAFVVDIPGGIMDASTVLPVQIFLWSDFPERGFVEKTSAAILVLLTFLVLMNAIAVFLRSRFERKW